MRILSKYDLFIFDWDHTLTTSTLLVTLLYLITRRQRGQRSEQLKKGHLTDKEVGNIELKEDVSKLYVYFDDLYSLLFKPKLKRGSLQVLELLKKHKKKVAIFSDSRTYRLMKETRELDVLKHVDFAFTAESIGYYKPHPMGLLLLRNKFRVPASKSIYVGDLATDVLTAKLAGVDSCAVADGIDSYDSLKKANPDYLMSSMESLLQNLSGRD